MSKLPSVPSYIPVQTGTVLLHNTTISLTIPNDEIFDWSQLEAFADDNKCTLKSEILFGMSGKHCGYQHFLLFPQCFQKLSFPEVLKIGIVWERLKHIYFTSIEKQVLTTYNVTNLSR